MWRICENWKDPGYPDPPCFASKMDGVPHSLNVTRGPSSTRNDTCYDMDLDTIMTRKHNWLAVARDEVGKGHES